MHVCCILYLSFNFTCFSELCVSRSMVFITIFMCLLICYLTVGLYFVFLGGKSILQGDYGVAWRLHRKLFSTALRQYLSDIPLLESRVCEQVQKLIQDFEAQDELAFDPADYFMRAVAGVITKITYGEDRDVTEDDLSELLHLNNTLIKNSEDAQDVVVLDFFPIMKYLPMASYRRFFGLKSKIFAVTRRLLKQHEEIHDPSQPSQDLVSSLLQARSKAEYENAEEKAALLSEDHMVNTLEDMFGAGYETTSTALKWVILFLVNYPQYQTEIQKEVDEVVGRVRKPNLADRPKMPFVHAVILETLRLANIVPQLVPHCVMRDTTLLNYRIPKNTVVFADAETIHLNPELWDNPKEFNPNRYLDEDGKLNTSKINYYPFGAGRRVCVGEALAKVELFLFLTWMLQEFTFVSEDGHDPPGTESIVSFFQYPKPYKIRAMKRE